MGYSIDSYGLVPVKNSSEKTVEHILNMCYIHRNLLTVKDLPLISDSAKSKITIYFKFKDQDIQTRLLTMVNSGDKDTVNLGREIFKKEVIKALKERNKKL